MSRRVKSEHGTATVPGGVVWFNQDGLTYKGRYVSAGRFDLHLVRTVFDKLDGTEMESSERYVDKLYTDELTAVRNLVQELSDRLKSARWQLNRLRTATPAPAAV